MFKIFNKGKENINYTLSQAINVGLNLIIFYYIQDSRNSRLRLVIQTSFSN